MADKFEVYLYNVPKLTPDGKSEVAVPPPRTQQCPSLEEAQKYAVENKRAADRVVLIQTSEKDGKPEQKLVERYREGIFEKAADIVRR
jgi:hypothetical protein